MLESMWSSMSSSMQLAQECLEKEGSEVLVPNNTIEGLERFAQLIDNGKVLLPTFKKYFYCLFFFSVLNRVRAKFVDTIIRLEHFPDDSETGVAIIIHVDR